MTTTKAAESAEDHPRATPRGLGRFVRARRRALHLTQVQLAARVGWSQERISFLENGRAGIPALVGLARLARGLEVRLSDLIRAAGFPDADPAVEAVAATAESAALLLYTLERILAIDVSSTHDVLSQASDWIVEAIGADKVDIFVPDASGRELSAGGTSHTPMGQREQELGLDHLRMEAGGRTVRAYQEGRTLWSGRVDEEGGEPEGLTEGLGIKSMVVVPLPVQGVCQGVLSAVSAEQDRFTDDEVRFLEALARYISLITQRETLLQPAPE